VRKLTCNVSATPLPGSRLARLASPRKLRLELANGFGDGERPTKEKRVEDDRDGRQRHGERGPNLRKPRCQRSPRSDKCEKLTGGNLVPPKSKNAPAAMGIRIVLNEAAQTKLVMTGEERPSARRSRERNGRGKAELTLVEGRPREGENSEEGEEVRRE